MKIKHGSSRTAVIVGGLVFKFPIRWGKTKSQKRAFYQGVMANISEYILYRLLKEHQSFLVPVYFSIGLVSIQKYEQGEQPKPGDDRYESVWNNLPEDAKRHLSMVDPHALYYNNWRVTPSGIRLIDYGDKVGQPASVSGFLTRWRKELDAALKSPSTSEKEF